MEATHTPLLRPTLHIEVLLKSKQPPLIAQEVCASIKECILDRHVDAKVGQQISAGIVTLDNIHDETGPELTSLETSDHALIIQSAMVVDYTGPKGLSDFHRIDEVSLDIQSYSLHSDQRPGQETSKRRRISQPGDDEEVQKARMLPLPNVALKDEWDSLIYDNALPAQLLRYLTRMLGVMRQPGLNLSTFNWNRLCLLHGPPGSGKSTLCRALAQKLSIRLSKTFPQAVFVEVNTNSMLSKYFGESGKLISALFEDIHAMAQSSGTLVCVVMDEVETIAGSREKVSSGGECNDGLRATNQLLTALDRIRSAPNIIVLCTSNLIDAIDPAFLDRVDIKQLIPSPSAAAIYNIFRSCLNELVRASLIDVMAAEVYSESAVGSSSLAPSAPSTNKKRAVTRSKKKQSPSPQKPASSWPEQWTHLSAPTIPSYSEMQILLHNQPDSPGRRVEALAQKCEGFSGRTLRRLPILGLAMYTWGGDCSLQDAVSALEAAVDQELKAKQSTREG